MHFDVPDLAVNDHDRIKIQSSSEIESTGRFKGENGKIMRAVRLSIAPEKCYTLILIRFLIEKWGCPTFFS